MRILCICLLAISSALFLAQSAMASATYTVKVKNKSANVIYLSNSSSNNTCIDSVDSKLSGMEVQPGKSTSFTFEDKNTYTGSCYHSYKGFVLGVSLNNTSGQKMNVYFMHYGTDPYYSQITQGVPYGGIYLSNATCNNQDCLSKSVKYGGNGDYVIQIGQMN